jgi:hypothetical protein
MKPDFIYEIYACFSLRTCLSLVVLLFTLGFISCDGTPPFTPPGSQPTGTTQTWQFTDSCGKFPSVNLRFFDKTDNVTVFPSRSTVFILDNGKTGTFPLSCKKGDNICFGACASTDSSSIFGVGCDGSAICPDCCRTCDNVTLTPINLLCP